MARKTIKSTDHNAWIKGTNWYRKALANERSAEARRMGKAPRERSYEADAQAVTYAKWLMQRDGVCLDTLRAKAVEAVPVRMSGRKGREWDENASLRNMIADAKPTFKVWWEPTQHGYRPRYVEVFEFRGSYPHTSVHRVELPNWAAAWEVVTDLNEALPLAA